MSFPFDLHIVAVSDSHLPCHAIPTLCSDHARREMARALPSRVWLLLATTRSSTKVVNRHIPISDAGGQCETKHRLSWTRKRAVAAHYKKDDLLHFWTSSSDISGYHVDIHEGHGTVRAGQGHGMRCVNRPLTFRHRASEFRYSPEKAFYVFNQQIYFII